MPSDHTLQVTVRLPSGRLLIAHLDPYTPHDHSPLRRALLAASLPACPAPLTATQATEATERLG